ncbi:MAG: GntR family transcriptional regulator [Bacillota bacterium]|nr:GntR family transcriptional regulator [Bacillota bacterium]
MDRVSFRPPENKALRVEVANEIVRAIANGHFKPGDRLVEQHIAKEMGISRAPIREALRELEGQGIVVTVPRKGAFVSHLGQEDVEELFTLRSVVEGLAARLAATRVSGRDLAQLTRYTEEMVAAARRKDTEAFVARDLTFHELIWTRSEHKRLLKVLDGIRTLTRLFMVISKHALTTDEQLVQEAEGHKPIIEALGARDAERAEAVIRAHITQAGERVAKYLREREQKEEATS